MFCRFHVSREARPIAPEQHMQIDRSFAVAKSSLVQARVYSPSKLIGLHQPLHITHIYISAHSRFVRQFCYYLRMSILAISHHHHHYHHCSSTDRPTDRPVNRPFYRKGPDRFQGVSNVYERDEMQTGAILFIVRRLCT